MKKRLALIAPVIALIFVFAVTVPATATARPAVTKEKLTVKITLAFGTVWGKVSFTPKVASPCSKTSCTDHIVKAKKFTLKETPVDSATWPFCAWKVNGKTKGKKPTLSFTMPAKATVITAEYTVPGSC